jgi:hypothetical protein
MPATGVVSLASKPGFLGTPSSDQQNNRPKRFQKMVNKINFDQLDFDKIGVAEPKRNDLTNKKGKVTGYWYSIGLCIQFPGMKTSGVTKNEYEDEKSGKTNVKYQFGTIGNLEEKYVKFFDNLRLAICEAVLRVADSVDYLEGFDPKSKKNPNRFYWQDKKNKARRVWYPTIGYNTSLFVPDSKSKSKTTPISKNKFIENRAKKIHYVIEQNIVWEIKYFYAGANILSIKNEINRSLIVKFEAKGASWDDPEEVNQLLKNNPDLESQIEENFKTARMLTETGDDGEDNEGSDAEEESDNEPPKKGKGKGKAGGNQLFKKLMDDDDDEEEETPKKKSHSKKSKNDEEEEDEEEEEETPKKKKDSKGKKGSSSRPKKSEDDEDEEDDEE